MSWKRSASTSSTLALVICSCWFVQVRKTAEPSGTAARCLASRHESAAVGRLLIAWITSPFFNPALSAGPPANTFRTTFPSKMKPGDVCAPDGEAKEAFELIVRTFFFRTCS